MARGWAAALVAVVVVLSIRKYTMNERAYKQRKQPDRLSTPALADMAKRTSTGSQPLDSATRAAMEPRFGHSFADVRVHSDAQAAESAAALGARAYTVGSNIVFDDGQYAPETSQGQHLLAHELTHVVQQARAGQAGSNPLSRTSDAAEVEARSVADQVVVGNAVQVQAAPSAAIARSFFDDWKFLPPKPVFKTDDRYDAQPGMGQVRERANEKDERERSGDKYPSPLTDPKPVEPHDPHSDPLYWQDWNKPKEPLVPFPIPPRDTAPGDYELPPDDKQYG